MGCASSKIDDSAVVELCRGRVASLHDALRFRYALAEAHLAYLNSLKSVGDSLHKFFHSSAAGDLASVAAGVAPPSPVLNLPSHRKGDLEEEESEEEQLTHHLKFPGSSSHLGSGHHLSLSSSDSPIHHLESDSEDEELHQVHSSSPPPGVYENHEDTDYSYSFSFNPAYGAGGYTTTTTHMNFMKKQPTPSVSYQQKPLGTESIQMGIANPPYHPYYVANQYPSSYYYGDTHNGGSGYMGYGGGGGMGGFFGGSPPTPPIGGSPSSSNKQQQSPPPPPPPPSASTWEFLNPFENIESNYPPYTPSRDWREVREEEGIPELEEEDYEVVKEVYGDEKLVGGGDRGSGSISGDGRKSYSGEKEEIGVAQEEAVSRPRASVSPDLKPVEYEVRMMDKEKDVGGRGRKSEEQSNVGAFKGRPGGFRNVSEVVKEIQVQFERASASGGELAQMLEVGKLPYQRKNTAYQVSSKMLCAIAPSLPSTSRDSEASSSAADVDEDMGLRSGNLSATLQKLYLWEKKLLDEVKVEEKMKFDHDKKEKKLRRLDERGAEAHKVDATQTAIRNLSAKIRISIQIIDKISVKVSKLRDEDLWLQLNQLIQGMARMWKAMLQCHQSQCQAVEGARGLDAIAFSKRSIDAHSEAVLQLEHELINWTSSFTNWIDAQKGCVRSLNDWLLKCIDCEPEETADGVAPFSPGRAGAPPVFVICHQWAQSLDRLSEKEVVDSMRVFAAMVFQFWERDKLELRQRMVADRDIERRVKDLEREDMKIHKQLQALDKRMVSASGDLSSLSLSGKAVYQSDTSNKTSLQEGLQHIFEAMDRYTSESLKVYEELLSRSEEVVRERARV